ncbi:choice-of-anchor L domain-containing protein, partial [Flavobacterium subsaxonicum]
MRKLLLTLLLFLGSLGVFAQSDVVVFSNNPNMTYVAGETMTFTVMVTNNGPQAALNVAVFFPIPTGIPIPAGVTKFWWTGSNGSAGTNVQLNNTIPTLNVNQTVTYTINIKIPDEYTLPIDPVQVTYATRSDIEVIKTDNQATYEPDTDVVYTITVVNHGPEATTKSVQITDAIPAGITQFSWTGNGNNGTNVPLVAQTGILDVGEEVTYTVTLHVPATFTGNLVNTVSYIATVTDPTPTCPQCTDTDVLNAGANLVVTTTNNQTTYTAGGTAVYTVTVTNNGPQDAAGVNVSVPVPAGVTITSWTGSNSSSGTGAVADAVGTLADGESVTYTITVAIPATKTGALSLNATATSTTTDPDTSCTLCTDTDFDASSADIVTTKTLGSGTAYTAGANAVYTITVHNNGPTAAQNVVVSDAVPAGLNAANAYWTGSNGTFGTGNLLDTIALLENGATVTYTFTIPVPSNFSQTTNIVNEVTVTSDTPDPVPGCTTCTVTATPNPMANLITLKTNNQASYLVNSSTTYTITVTNPGPSDAFNVVVKDNKPYYIDVMTWEGNGTGGSGSFTNTIPVLAAGESMTYTVQIFIPEDYASFVGNLTNTAIITSGTPDPIPACPGCIDTDTPRGNFVTTSNDQYTVPELIEDVLIDVNCVGIDNVTWSTGTNYGSWNNGIAYFHANNSTFPIYEGVVLTSGNAVPTNGENNGVDGPNLQTISSTNWPGDADLQAATGTNTVSASWIKFNFVPVSDSFSFNFLFASEEYGNASFECNFTDVFAFLLINETLGETTPLNLAVIPETTIPVGVTTIHPSNPGGCGAVNEEYFGQYNTGAAAATAPINFNGQTIIMQASAEVVPNDTYSIKLAIANGNDGALNSAVFIEAGSFDIGQPQLPPDITLGNEALLLCHGDTFILDAAVANEDMLVKWKQNGEWILDEDGEFVDTETITVSEPGTYTVLGYFASNPECFISDDIVIDFYPEIMAGEPIDLEACGTTANGVTTGVFNLTQNNTNLLNGMAASTHPIKYYASELDATEGFPVITAANAAAYTAVDGYEIFVTIEDYDTGCLLTKSFILNILDCNVPLTPIENLHICEVAPYNQFEIFDLTSQNDVLLNQLDPADFTVTYHNSQADANTGDNAIDTPENYNGTTETIYIRVERNDNPTAFGTTSFDLIVTPQPAILEVEDVEACNSYILPEIEVGSYYTAANGQGQLLEDGSPITETQTVYIFAQEGEAPYTCTDEASFVVTIYNTPVIAQPQDVIACEGYVLPELTLGNYFTGANGTGTQLFAESIIEETQVIHIFAASGDEDFSCPADVFFTVTITNPPVVADAIPLEACDYTLGDANPVNDFSAAFDLTQAGTQVIGNQTGLTVTYY